MPLHQPTQGDMNSSSTELESVMPVVNQKMKKTVTFQETTTIIRFHDFGECTWHGIDDRKRFLCEARREATEWINRHCYSSAGGQGSLSSSSSSSYDFLLKDTFLLHNNTDTDDVQERITAYAQLPGQDYCRGLERYVCREHGLKRDSFKRGAIRAIVNEGKKRKQRGMAIDKTWMQLGEISRHLSSAATRFAHRVGIADEMVVRYGEDVTKVLKLQQDVVDKMIPTTNSSQCPAQDSEVNEGATITVSSNNLDDHKCHSHHQDQQQTTTKTHLERHNSQRSVTAVNVWCHGPRESNVPIQVPAEIMNHRQ